MSEQIYQQGAGEQQPVGCGGVHPDGGSRNAERFLGPNAAERLRLTAEEIRKQRREELLGALNVCEFYQLDAAAHEIRQALAAIRQEGSWR